mgnify:CR=1 FL=1
MESAGRTWRFQHVHIGNPQCAIEVGEELEELARESNTGVREARAKRIHALRRPSFLLSGLLTLDAIDWRSGQVLVNGKGRPRTWMPLPPDVGAAIASYLGLRSVEPTLLRRNIVIQGINLLALKHRQFRLGTAVLEYTGECHPCSRMEENLGTGGYNAVRGHGGITARVLAAGEVRIGDRLVVL